MKKPQRVADYLEHIAEAIDRITGYIQGIDDAVALERDHKIQDAVIRNIEIIGEAANDIHRQHPQFVTAHPELPWRQIRGMSNRMVHNYFDVNIDVLWITVKDDLPKLKQQTDILLVRYRKQNPPSR